MRRFFRIVSVVVSLAVFEDLAYAHHSRAGIFDSEKDHRNHRNRQVRVVAQPAWTDPSAVRDEKGVETIWDAETASISILRNRGVDGSPVRVGDRVTIAGSPSMRARPEILARSLLLPMTRSSISGPPPPTSQPGKPGVLPRVPRSLAISLPQSKADGLFRVWSTIMSDPAAFPMFRGGYPLTAAGKAGLAKWNPRNSPPEVRHQGPPLMRFSAADGVQQEGDTIVALDATRCARSHESQGGGARHWQRFSLRTVGKARRWSSRPITLRPATSITRARHKAIRSRRSSASSRMRITAVSTTS